MKTKLIFFVGNFALLASTLLFAFSAASFAQLPPPPPAPRAFQLPSIKNLPAEEPFVSIDAGYGIALPEPAYGDNWLFQEGRIGINFTNGGIAGSEQELEAISESYDEVLLAKLAGKITDRRFYDSNGFPASLTYFAFTDGKFGVRKFVLAKQSLYIMFALFNNFSDAEFFASVFNTFKIVGEAEIDRVIQRKAAEATPSDLPQKSAPKNYLSDLKEENLKGKIKKIVEETETVSSETDKSRKLVAVREYGEKGDLTKIVRSDYRGNPESIEVYGFIDGKRVSKTGYVRYSYNPPPPPPPPPAPKPLASNPSAPKPPAPKPQPESKRDLRYTIGYEKKHKDGKLIEKTFYSNNGSVWQRQVSNYAGSQLEFLVFSADGKLSRKLVSTLDKKGFIVEETGFDVKTGEPRADRKYTYVYEFDRKGNWIKKTAASQTIENGKAVSKALYISYRTINYYD